MQKSAQCIMDVNSTQGNTMKDASISVRIDREVKSATTKAAADDQRSLASLVEKVLREFLKKKGLLK